MKLFREQPEMLAIPILLALLGLFAPGDLNFASRPVLQGFGLSQPAMEAPAVLCPTQRVPVPPQPPVYVPQGAELI